MNQLVTKGIVLTRTNYGEADRIITVLTVDQGKIRLVAKGVRKIKSRLAGGIELFSVNDITYIVGKGDLGTLTSSRLITNYAHIVKDVERTMYAYDVLKSIHRITEDSPGQEYFDLLNQSLAAINNTELALDIVRLWINLRLLSLGGHSPNLQTDSEGKALAVGSKFSFSFEDMSFSPQPNGPFDASSIKFLRLALMTDNPAKLALVGEAEVLAPALVQLSKAMLVQNGHIRL